jgi:hypothetical protein
MILPAREVPRRRNWRLMAWAETLLMAFMISAVEMTALARLAD